MPRPIRHCLHNPNLFNIPNRFNLHQWNPHRHNPLCIPNQSRRPSPIHLQSNPDHYRHNPLNPSNPSSITNNRPNHLCLSQWNKFKCNQVIIRMQRSSPFNPLFITNINLAICHRHRNITKPLPIPRQWSNTPRPNHLCPNRPLTTSNNRLLIRLNHSSINPCRNIPFSIISNRLPMSNQ
jgi:hypothetical protein